MVKTVTKDDKNYYVCEECGFAYKEEETAQKCQDWCNKYKSCNLEITKDAVKLE